ncbi:MAG: TIGR00282 family metallophosphoesterase [Candidatus Gracilibacteria bacterium]|nr:TIGR00282 family metallophosphoesterase [Candidatus Gracilibacteria bacterium]MDD2908404.1 TIGR00282 family metallophosphoesterase [Candidatus Gracilibacteria bacterium]
MLKFLILGDIFGRNGRRLVKKFLPELKKQYSPDFMIANSENMTSGRGAVVKHILEMKELGFDCLTGGNHSFANLNDNETYINSSDSIQIRPANYFDHPEYPVPGKGYKIIEKNGKKILVINLLGNSFMGGHIYNPFMKVDEILAETGNNFDSIIVDFHRETTAESYALSEYLSGKVTLVYGTHTHVQTNDEHILSSGTAMITDIGMVGSLHSSLGQKFESRIPNFATGINIFSAKNEVDMGPGLVNGIYVEIEDRKCIKIEKVRLIEKV